MFLCHNYNYIQQNYMSKRYLQAIKNLGKGISQHTKQYKDKIKQNISQNAPLSFRSVKQKLNHTIQQTQSEAKYKIKCYSEKILKSFNKITHNHQKGFLKTTNLLQNIKGTKQSLRRTFNLQSIKKLKQRYQKNDKNNKTSMKQLEQADSLKQQIKMIEQKAKRQTEQEKNKQNQSFQYTVSGIGKKIMANFQKYSQKNKNQKKETDQNINFKDFYRNIFNYLPDLKSNRISFDFFAKIYKKSVWKIFFIYICGVFVYGIGSEIPKQIRIYYSQKQKIKNKEAQQKQDKEQRKRSEDKLFRRKNIQYITSENDQFYDN